MRPALVPDDLELRYLVTHGYEKQGHSHPFLQRIRVYLNNGDPAVLEATRYATIRKGLLNSKSTS